MSESYESAIRLHEQSAQRHRAAAALWDSRQEAERAEFERQCAHIELRAAELDAGRAELVRLRASGLRATRLRAGGLAHPDAALHGDIERLAQDIQRRSDRLLVDDAALEQERARLWPQHGRRELRQIPTAALAPAWRDGGAREPNRGQTDAADTAFGTAKDLVAQTRENAEHLSSLLSQTGMLLETSAAFARANAKRLERDGRPDAAAEERREADRAGEMARRARLQAEEWLGLTPGP